MEYVPGNVCVWVVTYGQLLPSLLCHLLRHFVKTLVTIIFFLLVG